MLEYQLDWIKIVDFFIIANVWASLNFQLPVVDCGSSSNCFYSPSRLPLISFLQPLAIPNGLQPSSFFSLQPFIAFFSLFSLFQPFLAFFSLFQPFSVFFSLWPFQPSAFYRLFQSLVFFSLQPFLAFSLFQPLAFLAFSILSPF